jgi:hypothetical protein
MYLRIFFLLLLLFRPIILHAEQVNNCDCIYTPKMSKDNPNPEITSFKDCGKIDTNGIFIIKKEHLDNVFFNKDDLACIYTPGPRVFYVRPNGKTIEAHYYDNGCDYFNEGLARGIANGRMAFFNKKLEIIIDTPYDIIFPFENDHAVVCNDCNKVQIDEYNGFRGGKCGYIDHTGQVVVPLEYPIENLPPINQ